MVLLVVRSRLCQVDRPMPCLRRMEHHGRRKSGCYHKSFSHITQRQRKGRASRRQRHQGYRRAAHTNAKQRAEPRTWRRTRKRLHSAARRRTGSGKVHARFAESAFHTFSQNTVCVRRGKPYSAQTPCRPYWPWKRQCVHSRRNIA